MIHQIYKCQSCGSLSKYARPIKGYILCNTCHYKIVYGGLTQIDNIIMSIKNDTVEDKKG